jgi:hypothetical protein
MILRVKIGCVKIPKKPQVRPQEVDPSIGASPFPQIRTLPGGIMDVTRKELGL